MNRRVVLTGVGAVNAGLTGGASALDAYLAAPYAAVARPPGEGPAVARLAPSALEGLIDGGEARRLSRVSQLAVVAARLALADAGLADAEGLGVVIGTEFGDLRSTMDFADGYLASGPTGLSALLFPNTVMNAMAAATTIAIGARELSLTLNAPTVAGHLAVARGAAAVAAAEVEAVLAGGVDEADPYLMEMLRCLGASGETRGEGAAFVVLESADRAAMRGARVLGELCGAGWAGLPARPHGVGRGGASRAIAMALGQAAVAADAIAWSYLSVGGDAERDAWEHRVLAAALAPWEPPAAALAPLLGQHAGLGALAVAAGAWTARTRQLPASTRRRGVPRDDGARALVHGVARGGSHVALVVGPAAA